MKNCYEYFVILSPKSATGEQDIFLTKLEKIMVDNDVEKVARDDWGKRALAYPIKKQKDARYILYHLKAPAAIIKELERNCRLAEVVLRYLVIRVDKLKPGVAPTELSNKRRGGGDRRGGRDRWKPGGGGSYGGSAARDSRGGPPRSAVIKKDAPADKPTKSKGD